MKETIDFRGDPFVDVGNAVLQHLLVDHPDWTIRSALEFATNVYVQSWQGKLHAFFLNSGITNPSNKGNQAEKTIEYYSRILYASTSDSAAFCRISGVSEPVFSAGRDNQILSGSGSFLNFNHGLESGLQVGQQALLSIFFAPLGCIEVQGRPALIHSNRPDYTALIAMLNLQGNLRPTNAQIAPGLHKAQVATPADVLFAYADQILNDIRREDRRKGNSNKAALTLYQFTNFGAKPDLALHHLSASVFDFYAQVTTAFPDAWSQFVRGCQVLPKAKKTKQTASVQVDEGYSGRGRNLVYQALLNGSSLLRRMQGHAKAAIQTPHRFPFSLAAYYSQKLLFMEQNTLDLIQRLAKHIVGTGDDALIKRTLTRLSTAKTSGDVRSLFVGLQRRAYEHAAEAPLIRLEEYVRYLFPESQNWREIKDLLLIALYEQLHDANLVVNVEGSEDEQVAAVAEDEGFSND